MCYKGEGIKYFMAMGVKLKREEIIDKLSNFNYFLIEEYQDEIWNRRVIISDSDGYKYDLALYSGILDGRKPPFVGKYNKFTLFNIDNWLKLNNKNFRLAEGNVYKNSGKQKLLFHCFDCQNNFEVRWDCVYSQNQGCTYCAKHPENGKSFGDVFPLLLEEWDYDKNKESPYSYFVGSPDKVWWICKDCGHKWIAKISKRTLENTGCGECSKKRVDSKIAMDLKKYFKNKYSSKEEYKILKNSKTNLWLPYDIYIPYGENPDLNGFYIEVHGSQHYHICHWHKQIAMRKNTTPEEEFEYKKSLDKLKKNFAKKNGSYIEIDIRKIKNVEEAIKVIENNIENRIKNEKNTGI